MKANKLIELTLAAIMLIFTACSGGDDNGGSNSGGNTDPKSSVNITTSSPTVPQTGASTTVSFVVSGSWTASSNQSWCHVSPTSGNQGTTTITVTCDDNDTYDERNATVTIKCGNASSSITVTQKQKDALLVTSNKIEIEAAGGEATIEVKANVDYDYTVEESAKSWISIGGTRALTTKNIILNIAENEEQTPREGKITISSSDFKEEVTVYQQGAVPSIVLTTKEFTVASSGETIKVELKSNTNYTIQMPNVKWITESSTRAMSSYTHYFKIEENTTYDSRSAEIIFKDESNGIEEKVTVNQLQKDAIVLAQSSYTIDYKATQLDFSVKSNVELEVSTSDSWIRQVSTRALTEKKLYFDIEENATETSRTGYIYITSGDLKQTITVNQKAQMTDPPYLTFTAEAEQTLQMNKVVAFLEYSVNDGEWEDLGTTKVTFGGTNGNLRIRGKSAKGTFVGGSVEIDNTYATISFSNSTPVACSGDIRTLIDYENHNTVSTENARFAYLFSGCTSLTKAPELPATHLASYCYRQMFRDCTSLTQAPELPANYLASYCYSSMFSGCTSLTKAPELPANYLASYCYSSMFYGCTSLTKAPELPANYLASYCYFLMFSGCTSLTKA
ncbi:MAG: BACON domain-containing protein, partial [Bacteroidaceae bacterium]|nr:BACON domain-containing protein [Bacteroidaceae bacterium]